MTNLKSSIFLILCVFGKQNYCQDSLRILNFKCVKYLDTNCKKCLIEKQKYSTININYTNKYYQFDKSCFVEYFGNQTLITTKELKKFWVWNLPSSFLKRKNGFVIKGTAFHSQGDDKLRGIPFLIHEIRY